MSISTRVECSNESATPTDERRLNSPTGGALPQLVAALAWLSLHSPAVNLGVSRDSFRHSLRNHGRRAHLTVRAGGRPNSLALPVECAREADQSISPKRPAEQ